jgi:prolyl-tRNA synthetase
LANREVGVGIIEDYPEAEKPIEKVYTPNAKSIEDVTNLLKIAPTRAAKSVFYKTAQGVLVLALIRGDLEVNEIKLSKIFKSELVFANDDEIRAAGAIPGFASGIGLKNCVIIADPSVANSNNLVAGSNEQDYHVYNFNLWRDAPNAKLVDIAMARNGDTCPVCSQGKLVLKRWIEVGQIFQLGTRYTTSMKMTYTDLDNIEKTPIMGCYGIGVGRNLACIAEARHDAKGIFWPITIAPWQVQINVLNLDNGNLKEVAEKLYLELTQQGLEVIYDDRNLPAGRQFAEADLLGIPLRLTISPRNMEKGQIEWKVRTTGESGFIDLTAAVNFVNEWVKNELAKINASRSIQQQ